MYEAGAEMEWYMDVHRMHAKAGELAGGNKLRTYAGFKKQMGNDFMCKYLNEIYSRKKQSLLSKFRIGVCPLRIETGRYEVNEKKGKGIPVHLRVCQFCECGEVEDEFHFLMVCPKYDELRSRLFECLGIEKEKFQGVDKLRFLFNDMLSDYPEYNPLRSTLIMRHIRISAFLWKAFTLRTSCMLKGCK
jgi:hypothetical protein